MLSSSIPAIGDENTSVPNSAITIVEAPITGVGKLEIVGQT